MLAHRHVGDLFEWDRTDPCLLGGRRDSAEKRKLATLLNLVAPKSFRGCCGNEKAN